MITSSQISRLATRDGVRRIAVENFLSSMDDPSEALANLELDARLYRWNAATVRAIRDGIRMAR